MPRKAIAQMELEYKQIEAELVEMFTRLQAELGSEVALLDVKRRKSDGIVVRLRPRNPAAAAICAHAENGLPLIDFNFGEYGCTWEIPIESSNPAADKNGVLQEIERMCRAVIAGKCQHSRGFLRIIGTVFVGDRCTNVTDHLEFFPKPPFHGTRTYEPYLPARHNFPSSTSDK